MGMTIPGMTVSAAAPATGGKAPAGAAAAGAAAIFGQSLQQLMGSAAGGSGNTAGQTAETPSNPLLAALQQLIAAAGEASGEGTTPIDAKELDAKLDDLLGQLDSLDDQLMQNPELMSMLQNWIQQAQSVLAGQGNETETAAEGRQASNTVEALASNPATLKFALQDTVAQLVELQKSPQTAPELKVQAQQALAALEHTVEENTRQTGTKTLMPQQNVETLPVQEGTQPAKTEQPSAKQGEVQVKADAAIVSSKAQTQQQSGSNLQQNGEQAQEAEQDIKPQGTITAGELALRTNGLTPAKPAEAVPVHRMAQEVEKLVVDRLEILQKQGFTEAKISLTPDHLGKVDIRITMHAGQLVAQFVTEHAAAKDMLEQQMAQLRGTLQGQGLTVEKLEVTQSSSLQSQMSQNGGQAGSGQQQGRRSQSREEANDDARLTAELGEELGEWLRQKTAAQSGSSFIAEA
ncbi:flagellar hook-length control protein FliK [Saccharibacillus alkalitolerans]|uniref:Flagellar hook-length control protein-like C-terminal domain-containing protein n=1 Tax=Saccharibacillus alkalitolerans TaxID=2705290 RepID=A0ABX0F3E4_9BACL|nr:flagellar hook-length control protein FliK [Saccharibacillus alkalitolerans]NGZ75503.1 hypothetical protein [Saccharibacillus alkalitolerans]